jgi:hypothetical protein
MQWRDQAWCQYCWNMHIAFSRTKVFGIQLFAKRGKASRSFHRRYAVYRTYSLLSLRHWDLWFDSTRYEYVGRYTFLCAPVIGSGLGVAQTAVKEVKVNNGMPLAALDCIAQTQSIVQNYMPTTMVYSPILSVRSNNVNPLKPNDTYRGRTAPLTSKRCVLYIYSTNIGTEYFKHSIYSPFFPSSKCSLFHNSNVFGSCIIHILYTGCFKSKK